MTVLRVLCALLIAALATGGLCAGHCEETLYTFSYGRSVSGRDLKCMRIGSEDAPVRFLMVFGIHGYEDRFPRDGQILCDIAHRVAEHFALSPEEMHGAALYIVPLANPDGLYDGYSNDAFGRLNADNLDIARDFATSDWKKLTSARNKTGDAPFATAEAAALRDLINGLRPTYGADVHGYIGGVYHGLRQDMADIFADSLDLPVRTWSASGMLCGYLDENTQGGLLIELPNPLRNSDTLKKDYAETEAKKLCAALESWFAVCAEQ